MIVISVRLHHYSTQLGALDTRYSDATLLAISYSLWKGNTALFRPLRVSFRYPQWELCS